MDIKARIDKANEEALGRMIAGDPVLVDIAPAGEVIPGLADRMILHSGPPIEWRRMCGSQRGAVIGQVLFEGWAATIEEATSLLESGGIRLEPNHHFQAVGPMAGTISKSARVWVVENRAFGNRAFCRQVEGRQQFGDWSAEAIGALRLWRDVWAPTLRKALLKRGGLELKPIITRALQMGDELHNRHSASSSLFANRMAVASGKAIADPARDVESSTMVIAMARNGTEFGIRVSGLGDEWFTAPSPSVEGLYLPGFS